MNKRYRTLAAFAVSHTVTIDTELLKNIKTPRQTFFRIFGRKPGVTFAVSSMIAITVLIGVWCVCAFYLTQVQIGNTSMRVYQNDQKLEKQISRQSDKYMLTLQYPNKKAKSFTLAQAGLKVDTAVSVHEIRRQQHSAMQFLRWWDTIRPNLTVKADRAKLHTFIAAEANVITQPSRDATIDLSGGQVKLTEAEPGKAYGLIKPDKTLMGAASRLDMQPLQLRILSVKPTITEASLAETKTKVESVLAQNVVFQLSGRSTTAKPSDIAGWLEVGPDKDNKRISVTVNSGKVLEYINKTARAYIHPPRAQIEMVAADGSIQVLVPGLSGVDVTDKNAVAASVTNKLLNGDGITIELPIQNAPFTTVKAGDYDKWIEVDVTNKRMYAYEHANVVRTFLVSAGAPKTPTVIGQYAIYAKKTQQDMRGRNVDGSRYFQPHVPWVAYFYKDYAIHGNYWRPASYFGNINSSHGCVGITPADGAWMYNWAPIGTPVIVHK